MEIEMPPRIANLFSAGLPIMILCLVVVFAFAAAPASSGEAVGCAGAAQPSCSGQAETALKVRVPARFVRRAERREALRPGLFSKLKSANNCSGS